MVVKAVDVQRMGFFKENCSAQLSGEAHVLRGRLSGIQFKVVIYDVLLVCIITSGHMTNMVVTPFDPPLQKTTCNMHTTRLRLLVGPGLVPTKVLHCVNWKICVFTTLLRMQTRSSDENVSVCLSNTSTVTKRKIIIRCY